MKPKKQIDFLVEEFFNTGKFNLNQEEEGITFDQLELIKEESEEEMLARYNTPGEMAHRAKMQDEVKAKEEEKKRKEEEKKRKEEESVEKKKEKGIFKRTQTGPWRWDEIERINYIYNLDIPIDKKDYGEGPVSEYYTMIDQILSHQDKNQYGQALALLGLLLFDKGKEKSIMKQINSTNNFSQDFLPISWKDLFIKYNTLSGKYKVGEDNLPVFINDLMIKTEDEYWLDLLKKGVDELVTDITEGGQKIFKYVILDGDEYEVIDKDVWKKIFCYERNL